ncbi:MAG: HDIG domain-containing metalloprotein, partial [Candidatus Absconditabacteria bacterium]
IEYSDEISQFIQKFKTVKQDEALKNAAEIITKVLPRVAVDQVSEFTVSNVDIPSEDTKGKLIGREGRNISYFEKVTGVELVIDDTPMMVKISSYDPEKRFLATETLKKLIKDGRINPVYIKKLYDEVCAGLDKRLTSKGEETLQSLGLPLMKPDIVKMIGQFYLRYSYGQNLLVHSIEVARIAELIANELGLDGILAKKAGILHDIGKISAITGQGHSTIGGDILRKYGFEEAVVNSAEGHHNDVPLTTPISWIVTAADAISASRPGARFNTKELFLERMSNLEKLISSISGTDKVFIMQAGREIMVFAKPDEVSDVGLEKLVKEIAIKVEDQLDYPGVIRVMAIRETKVVDYLK